MFSFTRLSLMTVGASAGFLRGNVNSLSLAQRKDRIRSTAMVSRSAAALECSLGSSLAQGAVCAEDPESDSSAPKPKNKAASARDSSPNVHHPEQSPAHDPPSDHNNHSSDEFEQSEPDECLFCTEEQTLETRTQLDCKHNFHTECLQKVENRRCPLCKAEITHDFIRHHPNLEPLAHRPLEREALMDFGGGSDESDNGGRPVLNFELTPEQEGQENLGECFRAYVEEHREQTVIPVDFDADREDLFSNTIFLLGELHKIATAHNTEGLGGGLPFMVDEQTSRTVFGKIWGTNHVVARENGAGYSVDGNALEQIVNEVNQYANMLDVKTHIVRILAELLPGLRQSMVGQPNTAACTWAALEKLEIDLARLSAILVNPATLTADMESLREFEGYLAEIKWLYELIQGNGMVYADDSRAHVNLGEHLYD